MHRLCSLALCFMLTAVSLFAQSREQGRLENAGVVMEEILNLPDSIPQDLLNKAECVIVVPSVTKVAIGIGGSYGRGAMVCRSSADFDGPWSAPAMYALDGTSLRPDDDASAEIYGHKVSAREIMRGTSTAVPDADRRLVDVLQKRAARNASTAVR